MTGLFVQVSTTPPGSYLSDLISHLRVHHPEIRDLAFSDCQPWDIARLEALDLYGFTVYVGAPPVPWYGPRPDTPSDLQPWMVPVAGVAGMLTPSYRWDQIAADQGLYESLRNRLGTWNVYVGSEVGIDALGDHLRLRQAWEAYLIELCRRVRTPLLWSPYAWDAWASVSAFRRNRIAGAMKFLVGNVAQFSQSAGIEIDLQDGRGAQPHEPDSDAVNWWRLIKDCGTRVRLNVELFDGQLRPQDPAVIEARLAIYQAAGIPIGCCWEAGYWLVRLYSNHRH